jgi:hypothetical protein
MRELFFARRFWAPTRLSKAARAAVEALPPRERAEFHRRFNAIREIRAKH